MLTPDKIKEKSFQTTGRGSYRADDVDSFLTEVSASYEQMFKENGDLIKKISILAKKVEEYRADEESLKLALLNAQKLADRIVAEAKEKAETENAEAYKNAEKVTSEAEAKAQKLVSEAEAQAKATVAEAEKKAQVLVADAREQSEQIVGEANRQSNEILGNINRKVTHESLVYEMIQKEASEFKGRLVAMYKEHINLINKLPEIADEQLDSAKAEEAPVKEAEEDTTPVIAEDEDETLVVEEPSVPEEAEEVTEEPEKNEEIEEAEEVVEEPVIEEVETVIETVEVIPEEAPAEPKKPFKLDLSKIDFADDEPNEPEVTVAEPVTADEPSEAEDEDDGEIKTTSFKNFFKKK